MTADDHMPHPSVAAEQTRRYGLAPVHFEYDQHMRRRGTARFVLALVVAFAVHELSFSRAMEVGHAAFGGWGLVAAVLTLGFGIGVLFTAIYDGPLALGRLLKRHEHTARAHGFGRERG